MKYITRWHIHIDRVACPWLIRKFVDKEAEFIFVPWPGQLPSRDCSNWKIIGKAMIVMDSLYAELKDCLE